jgi:hypothetical protein
MRKDRRVRTLFWRYWKSETKAAQKDDSFSTTFRKRRFCFLFCVSTFRHRMSHLTYGGRTNDVYFPFSSRFLSRESLVFARSLKISECHSHYFWWNLYFHVFSTLLSLSLFYSKDQYQLLSNIETKTTGNSRRRRRSGYI